MLSPSPPITFHILPVLQSSLICSYLQVSSPWPAPLQKTGCMPNILFLLKQVAFWHIQQTKCWDAKLCTKGLIHKATKQKDGELSNQHPLKWGAGGIYGIKLRHGKHGKRWLEIRKWCNCCSAQAKLCYRLLHRLKIQEMETLACYEGGVLGPLMSKGHGQTLVQAQLEGWWS